jgi:putative Mg2+ transporter-C (MgtC) family protein
MNILTDVLTQQSVFSPLTIILRVACAMLAAFIVGYERSKDNQPAGMRTHMAITLGACSVMMLSIFLPIKLASSLNVVGDPGRMAAQVVSGIGFLGAGAIFRFGFNVRGLTTAASIWTMSGVGLVFGAGFYVLGLVATLSLYFILHVVNRIEHWLITKQKLRIITVIFSSSKIDIKSVMNSIRNFVDVKNLSLTENVEKEVVILEAQCRVSKEMSVRKIFEDIKSLGGVQTVKIE